MEENRFRINRIAEAPDIDGRIGEAEWAGAARVSDLHEVEPVEFTTPSERTVWYFAYDDKALYVAAHAYDSEPDLVSASVLRQGGNLFPDDRMAVIIDPFNNKRSGYSKIRKPVRWRLPAGVDWRQDRHQRRSLALLRRGLCEVP